MKKQKNKSQPTFFNKIEKEFIVLTGFVVAYISYLIYFTFLKHLSFLTGRYDLGNMDQTVWNTLQGNIFIFTNPDFNLTMSRLSVHSDFILVLFAPFYALWDDARMLLIIQTVIIACGAFFVYGIGKILLSQKLLPLILAISYLINPYVNEQNMFDFHSVSLATTFILAAFYFLLKKNYVGVIIFSVLALLTKEHLYLIMGLFGLYLFFFKKKVWAIAISIVSFIIFYLLVSKFIPGARAADHFALTYYSSFGNSPSEIVETLLVNPMKVLTVVMGHDPFSYLKLLLMPVGYLSVFAPFALLFAIPEFSVNILSKNEAYRSYEYHYAATMIPFIYISAFYGIRKILIVVNNKKAIWILAAYTLIFSLCAAWYFGPLPGARKADYSSFATVQNRDAILHYMRSLPNDIAVAATNNIGAHVAHRQNLYTTSDDGIMKADMVLVLTNRKNERAAQADIDLKEKILQNSQFSVVYEVGDFTAFKRTEGL